MGVISLTWANNLPEKGIPFDSFVPCKFMEFMDLTDLADKFAGLLMGKNAWSKGRELIGHPLFSAFFIVAENDF